MSVNKIGINLIDGNADIEINTNAFASYTAVINASVFASSDFSLPQNEMRKICAQAAITAFEDAIVALKKIAEA